MAMKKEKLKHGTSCMHRCSDFLDYAQPTFRLASEISLKDAIRQGLALSIMIFVQGNGSVRNLVSWPYAGKPRIIWHSSCQPTSKPSPTAVLSLSLEHLVYGYGMHIPKHSFPRLPRYSDDGHVRQSTFNDFISGTRSSASAISDTRLSGSIVSLHQLLHPRTKESILVGGADDGSIAFWNLKFVVILLT